MKQLFFITALIIGAAGCKPDPGKQAEHKFDTSKVPANMNGLGKLQDDIAQSPDSVKLYGRMIDTLANRKLYLEAAAWCDKLLDRGADSNYYYWFVKADIFRRGALYDSAIAAYETYLTKFPDDEQILLNLASTYAEAGNKSAVDLANRIAARYPTREMRSEAAFIKGVYYNQAKQYKEARRWLDTAIVINYNFEQAYMEKGYSLYDEQLYKEALTNFNTLLNINNSNADGWYWKAKCQEALGNRQDAISSYEQAYLLDSSIKEAIQSAERLRTGTAKNS